MYKIKIISIILILISIFLLNNKEHNFLIFKNINKTNLSTVDEFSLVKDENDFIIAFNLYYKKRKAVKKLTLAKLNSKLKVINSITLEIHNNSKNINLIRHNNKVKLIFSDANNKIVSYVVDVKDLKLEPTKNIISDETIKKFALLNVDNDIIYSKQINDKKFISKTILNNKKLNSLDNSRFLPKFISLNNQLFKLETYKEKIILHNLTNEKKFEHNIQIVHAPKIIIYQNKPVIVLLNHITKGLLFLKLEDNELKKILTLPKVYSIYSYNLITDNNDILLAQIFDDGFLIFSKTKSLND